MIISYVPLRIAIHEPGRSQCFSLPHVATTLDALQVTTKGTHVYAHCASWLPSIALVNGQTYIYTTSVASVAVYFCIRRDIEIQVEQGLEMVWNPR